MTIKNKIISSTTSYFVFNFFFIFFFLRNLGGGRKLCLNKKERNLCASSIALTKLHSTYNDNYYVFYEQLI